MSGDLAEFPRQHRRKSDALHDPNDRHDDRELEAELKRMPPEELDRLLQGDIDDGLEADSA